MKNANTHFNIIAFALVLCAGFILTFCETVGTLDKEGLESLGTPTDIIAFADAKVKQSCS